MTRLFTALAGLALLGAPAALHAQTPTPAPGPARPAGPPAPPAAGSGEIRGSVADATSGAPVLSASVAVWSRADSSLVTGAVVGRDGGFRIRGLRPGSYYLRVSALGYEPARTGELAIGAGASRASAGTVRLAPRAVALEGLVVTGERTAVSISPDRNSYRPRDVSPSAATATDVLEAVPAVQVDADGKVSLRGNDNVAVQINGRPTAVRGEQLAAYLKQLPANLLERVEVVPSPSAKYDPEGMAGIINLVLKEGVDLGSSGGLTLAASTADRYTGSVNAGHQSGPLTLFASYGFNSDDRDVAGWNDRARLGAGRIPLSYTETDITGELSSRGHNLNASADLRVSRVDVLSTALIFNRRRSGDESLSEYDELNATQALLSRYDRVRSTAGEGRLLDYTLALKRTLEPQKHELAAEIRVSRNEDEDRTELWRRPVAAGGELVGTRLEGENNALDAATTQLTGQADYTRTLAGRTKVETGYKGISRWLDRDYLALQDPRGTGQWEATSLSNNLRLDEQVHAAYGVVSRSFGKLDLQGGLRAEYATRSFELEGTGEFPLRYTSLFPSGVASYRMNTASLVKLSYSRRVRRPGTQELNPFPVFYDVQNVFLGNPALSPEYTDAFEMSYQRSGRMGSLQISPFYLRTTDVIRFIVNTADTVAGREVTSVSFKNLDISNSWGADTNGTLRLGKAFTGLASFSLVKVVTDGGNAEAGLASDAITWFARLNGTYQFTPALSLQGSFFYRAPMDVERARIASSSMTDFTLRRKLRGDRATVSLRVSDPFNTAGMHLEAGDDNLTQISERKVYTRAAHLTFQYNVGKAPRIRQRRPDQSEAPVGFPQ